MGTPHPPRWLNSRHWIQFASFIFSNSWLLSRFKGFCYPVLNCWACPSANFACPIGALQNACTSARLGLAGGQSLWQALPLYVLGTLLFFSALFGRMMCGWLCPCGWLQELLNRRGRQRQTPRWSWHIRYLVLISLVLVIPYVTTETWFSKLCPMGALQGAIPQPLLHPDLRSQIGWLWGLKIAILAATIGACFLWRRPFCAVICPLGAIFGLFNRLSAWRIDYERSRCTDCLFCVRICPQGLDPRRDVNSHACIGCLECMKCPYHAIKSRPQWAPLPEEKTNDL